MNMRFEDGNSSYHSGLRSFVADHPYLSLFVGMMFGVVVGNFVGMMFGVVVGNIARIFFL